MELDYAQFYVELEAVSKKLHAALLEGQWDTAEVYADGVAYCGRALRAAIADHKAREQVVAQRLKAVK